MTTSAVSKPSDQEGSDPAAFLDTFEHVVVLMLENRSFDNLLGYLYPNTAERPFAGAAGHSNPNHDHTGRISTSNDATAHSPFPDPGEYIMQCMQQLYGESFNGIDFNNPNPPSMQGFVENYFSVLTDLGRKPLPFTWPGDAASTSAQVMMCHSPQSVPALSTLAGEFAVFDHWFCALPSATWPNRAFWHADTSYGWADNPTKKSGWSMQDWIVGSDVPTLFSQLQQKFPGDAQGWRIYSDQIVPLTTLVHAGSMGLDLLTKLSLHHYRFLEHLSHKRSNFFTDCANADLPKYSFLEPHFLNLVDHGLWHNDMHPSKFVSEPHWILWGETGPGSVPLGDQLVLSVYEAIRNSPLRDQTLFIIAFDEHGGCFDHVPPPQAQAPDPTSFYHGKGEYGFKFERLGPRVPMVMVSSHIAQGTLVTETMNHASFLKSMQEKWSLPELGPRQMKSKGFAASLGRTSTREGAPRREWPDLSHLRKPAPSLSDRDLQAWREDNLPLSGLQQLILEGTQRLAEHAGVRADKHQKSDSSPPTTMHEATTLLAQISEALGSDLAL